RAARGWRGARRASRTAARTPPAPARAHRSGSARLSTRARAAQGVVRPDPIRSRECRRRGAAGARPRPAPGCSRHRRRVLELFGLVVRDDVVAEVVGADLLGPLAGADLAAAILGDRVLLLAQLDLVEAGAQHFHRLRLVLDLRLLVLLRDDDAAWQVGDADRGIRGVDALS